MKILETDRLILRHLVFEDLDDLYKLYCDPDLVRYIPDAPKTYKETQKELQWHMNGNPQHPELGLWAAIHKKTNRFIGRCGLIPWKLEGQDEVEIAYLISKDYWGQGLGSEVAQALLDYGFEKLNLSRLICLIDQDNLPSKKVAEKIGMRFEKEGRDEIGPFLLYARNKSTKHSSK